MPLRAPLVPAFLHGRKDFELQEVWLRRTRRDAPLGLGLERMGLGDASCESIVVDEVVRNGVVGASGAMQVGSLLQSVHGRVLVGERGASTPGSFTSLLEGIRSQPHVRLGVLRPMSLDCLVAGFEALRARELADLARRSRRSCSTRRMMLRLLSAELAAQEVTARAKAQAHATEEPYVELANPAGWERRIVRLVRDPRGSGLGLRLIDLGTGLAMVDELLQGGPAAAAHTIQVGSVLAKVNGLDCGVLGITEMQRALSGTPGAVVELELLQPSSLAALLTALLRLQETSCAAAESEDVATRGRSSTEDYDTCSEHDDADSDGELDATLSSGSDEAEEVEEEEPIAPTSWQRAATPTPAKRIRRRRGSSKLWEDFDVAPFEIVIEH